MLLFLLRKTIDQRSLQVVTDAQSIKTGMKMFHS